MNGLQKLQRIVAPTLIAGIVAAIVSGWQNAGLEPQARAQTRSEPRRTTSQEPDQHFKTGGLLSEAVLQEILTVLKRMDERLERMEKSVEQVAGSARSPVTGSVSSDDTRLPAVAPPISVRRNR